jgi:nitroimidazol reductase NimA-like FMN-containing flavoprotein (pyridoxamine 5'-phosphate oxidase superfamily)
MPSRRDAIKMTDDEVWAFLDGRHTLQTASINKDGTPHLVAMYYAVMDGRIAFWTYGKSQKVLNLQRDPRISVMVETGEAYSDLKGVTVTGQYVPPSCPTTPTWCSRWARRCTRATSVSSTTRPGRA